MAPPDDQFPPSVLGGESPDRLMEVESVHSSNPGSDGRMLLTSGTSSTGDVPSNFDAESVWSEHQHIFDYIEGLVSNFNPASAPRRQQPDNFYVSPKRDLLSTDSSTSGGGTGSSLSTLSEPPHSYSRDASIAADATAVMVVRRVVRLVKDSYTQVTEEEQDALIEKHCDLKQKCRIIL